MKHVGGKIENFANLDDAVIRVGWYRIEECRGRSELGCQTPRLGTSGYPIYGRFDWIGGDPVLFFDEMGLLIPVWKIRERAMALRLHYYPKHWFGRWSLGDKGKYTFRDGPVPGIWNRRGGKHRGSHQRLPLYRENSFLFDFDEEAAEYKIKPRKGRDEYLLWWDGGDYKREDRRNWKKYRTHQWRER